jgi:hypothetical protein
LMTSNRHASWRSLASDLQRLRSEFPNSHAGITALGYFDEFLSANELGLALHILCDFFLEPDAPPTSQEQRLRLQSLHSSMEIVDDCVARLQQKAALD